MTFEAVRRSVFEGRALPSSERVKAVALPSATRFNLRGGPDIFAPLAEAFGVAPPMAPMSSAEVGARTALWLGPDEWLLIAEEGAGALFGTIESALVGVFHTLVDISHRQVGIEVSGPGAVHLLNAGCPLDLDLSAFPVGMATRTLLIKAEIGLWRRAPDRFQLEIGRSFAPYVAAVLTRAARDQGEG